MREQKAKEYLQTIYALQTEGDVRGAHIAREMELTKATVSVALRTLAENGYVTIEQNHTVHLTQEGLRLAKTAIHETVHRGRSYHSMLEKIETDAAAFEDGSEEQRLKWLRREGMEPLLEALLVLGKHYYHVRNSDLAECLDAPTATVTKRIRRLEEHGFVLTGSRNIVELTEMGKPFAETFYARHENARRRLMGNGLSEQDAELEACLVPFDT